MEFLYGFLSNISRDLVCGAVNQLRYPCCFNTFVEQLKKEEDDLIATRNSVQDRVAHAKKQGWTADQVVDKWLKDADIDTEDPNYLKNKAITKKSCCFGHCPNWILRYHFGRKLANKKKELEELNKKGGEYLKDIENFQRVATLPPETLNFASDKCLKFESRESAYKQIMEAVKNEEVNMIGLYGMGGCGKTTLAEQVMKIAEAEHLFDKVLLVTVSSTVEVGRIQERIASSMQYTFQVNEERDRARALCHRLTQEKKILVILDDVWQILDFGAIGIPLTEHHKGCKVLITTRSEDVCTSMDCQKKIQLQILTNVEAWTLFQKQAGISEDTSDSLKHLAREISDECKGLPVAIAAVAGSLKGKDEVIWRVALNRLRNSKPMNIEKGLRDPYNCLQLSYDNLDTEEAKSLFLLCSVFPEDYKIRIEDLTKVAIGLGVVGEVNSYDAASSEVIAGKIKLVSSCLLTLDADHIGFECVKMHDLVRDVAHFIAKNENKVIKCQLEKDVTLEQSSIRYLWCKEFPNDLDCSNLEFLCIYTKLEILDENFKRMGKLRVLRLINEMRYTRIKHGMTKEHKRPLATMSFKTLTNLRYLILEDWELSDISFVRYTKKLQSLSLRRCSLPSFIDLQTDEFYKQLTNLKMLELIRCVMERNNYNVIGRISGLEELRIVDNNMWKDCASSKFFKMFSVPKTLQCYGIKFGHSCFEEHEDDKKNFMISREGFLFLPYFHISNEAFIGLAKRAKDLCMKHIEGGAKNMIPDIFQMKESSMHKLNKLRISHSKEIECLVDTSNHSSEVETLFSELLRLKIGWMDKFRVLWQGCLPPHCGIFQKLEQLEIWNCPELKPLFTHSAVESIEVEGMVECEYDSTFPRPIVPSSTSSTAFQNLRSVTIRSCEKLKYVFSAIIVKGLPQLKWLYIEDCKELDQIIEDITPSASFVNYCPGSFILFGLTRLVIYYCPRLSTLFMMATAKTLVSLKELVIRDCDDLKYIVNGERAHKNKEEDIVEAGHDLQSVISIFPNLKTVEIIRCAKLKVIFPLSRLPELVMLEIKQCKELKQIMEQDLEENKYLSNLLLPQPHFAKLTKLVVEKCPKLKRVFSTSASISLSNLEILIINGALELEELIGCEHGKGHEIEKPKVDLSKLKLLIFMNLLNLCQGIELLAVKHRIVHNCPKLTLTSTTTLYEFYWNFPHYDFGNAKLTQFDLNHLIREINESDEVLTSSDTSESPSLQISEESEKEFIGKVDVSMVHASTTLTNLELNGMSSPNPLDISQGETSIEWVDQESNSEASFPDKNALEDTMNIEDIRKESIQDVHVSKRHTNKTLSIDVEDINLGGGVATHTKSSTRFLGS